MNYSFAIPVVIATVAFFFADDSGSLFRVFIRRSTQIPDKTKVRDRLLQLGRGEEEDYENFRIAQMALTVPVLFLLTISTLFNIINIFSGFIFLIASCIAIFLLTERNLTNRCAKRREAIESEFPAVIEMLTLSIGAGESPVAALKRIALRARGYLAEEFKVVVSEVEAGSTFSRSVDEMSRRTNSDTVRRFSDSLIISISRGTPLVETLTHNSNESRSQERVRLLTAAGKSELTMMIPVVFLILPISILFALFPSLSSLNLIGG